MPKYKSTTVALPLPKRTLDYLENGAPEGSRNAELFDACGRRFESRMIWAV